MEKRLMVFLFISLFFLAGCNYQKTSLENRPIEDVEPQACTLEAKICPDGSAVGRGGLNCEFSPCPNISEPSPNNIESTDCPVGQKFYNEDCSCPSPWNIRIGSLQSGFQCAGMPNDRK